MLFWFIVLLLFAFLIGFSIGRQFGMKEGFREGYNLAPLELLKHSLESKQCAICQQIFQGYCEEEVK